MNLSDAGTPSEREIVITRVFNAPRELLWKAWNDPAHVEKWWGPRCFTTRVTELDLRVGGRWRYVMVGPDGAEYPVTGVFREVVPYERIVTSDDFAEGFANTQNLDLPQGIVMTALFEDLGSQSRLTLRLSHPTLEDRRKHEAMGVVGGWNSSFDCLDDHLATLVAAPVLVQVSRRFPVSASTVYDAWLDPAQLGQWMFGPGVRDEEIVHLQVDPRVGGTFSFAVRRQGVEFDHSGTYRELVRPERLVFTWGIRGQSTDESVVTLEIRSDGDGCELTLTHVMDPKWAEFASRTEAGWTRMLGKLADSFANSRPSATADREIVVSRVFDARRELVFDAWTDVKHISNWWGPRGFTTTTHASDPRPGGLWRFTMHGPDGVDSPNLITWVELQRPDRLAYRHTGEGETADTQFDTTVTFVDRNGKTEVTLRLLFASAAERNHVADKYGAVEGGRETLQRLAEHLERIAMSQLL